MRKSDAIELEVLRLGRQHANAADDHTHRGRNHLEQVAEALVKLEATDELRQELAGLMERLGNFHARLENIFSVQARTGGSRITDREFLQEMARKPPPRDAPPIAVAAASAGTGPPPPRKQHRSRS